MSTLAPPKIVVADASVLINFANIDRFDLLAKLPGHQFVVPEEVHEEVTWPDQAARLAAAIAFGHLRIESTTDLAEIALASTIRQSFDRGESACLAMAQHRGWSIGCDERGSFLHAVHRQLGNGRLINTPGLLVLAIRANLIDPQAADQFKAVLERHRFRMPFTSFGEFA